MTITEGYDTYDAYRNYITSYYDSISRNNRLRKICELNIKTKLEIFKKYIEVFTEDFQSKCTKSEKISDFYIDTCGDIKQRKLNYFM